MPLDYLLEIDHTLTPSQVLDAIGTSGGRITAVEPGAAAGVFPASGLAFFYHLEATPRQARAAAEPPLDAQIGSELKLNPHRGHDEAGLADAVRLMETLARRTSGQFVLSVQYERVLAGRHGGDVVLSTPAIC